MNGSPWRNAIVPSPNAEPRPAGVTADILLLHYTGMATAAVSLQRLCAADSKVSCHYLVDEEGHITQMVDEDHRAWHAGAGSWQGTGDINSRSIGIEIQNIGHNGDYPPFGNRQMQAVITLCRDIVVRRGIRPERVLGHSDTAPSRKTDPGEKFDWQWLHRAGVGHWVAPSPIVAGPTFSAGASGSDVEALQHDLSAYGYELAVNGNYDEATVFAVTAFQRHFRPQLVDGVADVSTRQTLKRLLAAQPTAAGGTA